MSTPSIDKLTRALELAVKIIEEYGDNEGYIPRIVYKEFDELQVLHQEIFGREIR